MEKFKELPLKQKVFILAGVTIFALILFYPNDEPAGHMPFDAQSGQYAQQQQPGTVDSQASQNQSNGSFFSRVGSSRGQQVTLFDRGLQMEMGTQTMPAGWSMQHDIYVNPQSGMPDRYFVEIIGSRGEIIRTIGMETYLQMMGQNFEQTWRTALQNTLRGQVQNLYIGNISRSESIPRLRSYREVLEQGFPTDPLEVEIQGIVNGQPYRGVFLIVHVQLPAMSSASQGGMVVTQLVLSPENQLQQALETLIEMDNSYIKNLQHEQRMQQIAQANFKQNQQRIDNQRNQFAEQNRQWSENFFGSWNTGSTTGGSSYSTNDQFLDAITGYSTFDDPHTGYQRQVEGHYRYNFTDGMGNYYGTDDPAFDYRSMQGNWQSIDPLRPNN